MNKVTIGVDVGAKGGLTFMCGTIEAYLVAVYPMPMVGNEIDLGQIEARIKQWMRAWPGEWHAWIEEAQAFPGVMKPEKCRKCGLVTQRRQSQGVVSTGTFMRGAGLVEGCLRTLGIECTLIKAQAWQKIMLGPGRPRGRVPLKLASIRKARELFPEVGFKRTSRCTTYSDGMADSALIAACGSKMNVS